MSDISDTQVNNVYQPNIPKQPPKANDNIFYDSIAPELLGAGEANNPINVRGYITGNFTNVNIGYSQISIAPGQSIQDAINYLVAVNAGSGRVFLKAGTYTVNSDITLSSHISLESENISSVTIDFGSQNYGIRAKGTNTYTTGNASVNVGSQSVTGGGTTWTSAMIGKDIFLGGLWYLITNVTGTTSLTIDQQYTATGISGNLVGGTYVICNAIKGVYLKNIQIQNSTDKAIDIENAYNDLVLDGISIYDSNYAVYFLNVGGSLLNNCSVGGCNYGFYYYNCTSITLMTSSVYNTVIGDGIRLDNSGDSTIWNFSTSNSGGNGLSLNNSFNTSLKDATINDNTGNGVEFIAGTTSTVITGLTCSGNGGSGIKLTATANNNILTDNICTLNGAYGINIVNANCNTNIVTSNNLFSNTSGQMSNTGTNTKIKSNIGVADGA